MAVKFNSSGGGSVLLDAPSTASNLTVTLPSASGTLVSTGAPFAGGTANGVVYLNGSSVPTAGSALTFDGTNLGLGSSTINTYYDRTQQIYGTASSSLKLTNATAGTANTDGFDVALNGTTALLYNRENGDMAFGVNNVEGMRLTSTGLGIGTSSPSYKLDVYAAGNAEARINGGNASRLFINGSSYSWGLTSNYQVGGAFTITNYTTGLNSVVLDSSGNLGLGVTPYTLAGLSNAVTFDMKSGPNILGYGDNLYMSSNAYYNSGWTLKAATGAMQLQFQSSTQAFYIYGAASGSAGGVANWVAVLGGAKAKTLALEGATSATGTGITFPATQSASSDANTLDDYEEGYVDLTLAFGGSSTGITYGLRRFHYVKIGQQVTLTGDLYITNKGSATGGATITGLPFTVANSAEYYSCPAFCYTTAMSYTGSLNGYAPINQTYIALTICNNGSSSTATNSNFTNTSEIIFSFTYFAAT